MKILINYANQRFERARRLNSWSGRHIAHFDRVCAFGPDDVDPDFRRAHAEIFAYERGNGLWLWKPYFICKVIDECSDGDYIFYLDSGAFFMRDPSPLYALVTDDNPIFVTDNPLLESCWTKPSCFDRMDAHAFRDTNQIQATYILFKVNGYTRAFFRRYLDAEEARGLFWEIRFPEILPGRSKTPPMTSFLSGINLWIIVKL